MMKIFSFIKNEEKVINDWILYHSSIVGCSNLYIINHASTDKTGIILDKWKKKGLNVFNCGLPFNRKASVISDLIKKHGKDIVIPMDADEFLTLKEGNEITAEETKIMHYIKKLPIGSYRYKFQQLDVIPTKNPKRDPLVELCDFKTKWYKDWKTYAKSFYHHSTFLSTDQGNHKGQVKGGGKPKVTDLTLIHYDVRDYPHFVTKMTKGATAYGHHSSTKIKGAAGRHYHRRYWAIKEGKGYAQMVKEFGRKGNFKTDVLSQKLKELRS